MTHYYVTASGVYLGGFDGALPPVGSVEVPFPPSISLMTWDGSKWIIPANKKDAVADMERLGAYNAEGCTVQDLTVALWKRIVEGDATACDAIEVTRKKIQKKFPK